MNNKKVVMKEDEIDLREIFEIFIKRKWWFIGSVIIVLIIGLIYAFLQPVSYTAIYKVDIGRDYTNNKLSEIYPDSSKVLNFITVDYVSAIFKTDSVFKSLSNISEIDDYTKLIGSDSIKISLNENTTIFDVSVSDSNKNLASKIAVTLIESLEDYTESKIKVALDNILNRIKLDIKNLEDKNSNFESEIAELAGEVDNLYEELDEYIVDYNVDLMNKLEEKEGSSGYTFYSIIIPPNNIQNKISVIQEEVINNESRLLDLNYLYQELLDDEEVITDKVEFLSEKPVYEKDSNRIRNLAIVVALSIIVGAIVVFGVNFLLNLRKR